MKNFTNLTQHPLIVYIKNQFHITDADIAHMLRIRTGTLRNWRNLDSNIPGWRAFQIKKVFKIKNRKFCEIMEELYTDEYIAKRNSYYLKEDD